jgi:YgiT-type zinc finger domain-containing protein
MKCAICRVGDTAEGLATFTYERDGRVVIIRNVPAQVCNTCSEAYYDEQTSGTLLREAKTLLDDGAEVAVISFQAA